MHSTGFRVPITCAGHSFPPVSMGSEELMNPRWVEADRKGRGNTTLWPVLNGIHREFINIGRAVETWAGFMP